MDFFRHRLGPLAVGALLISAPGSLPGVALAHAPRHKGKQTAKHHRTQVTSRRSATPTRRPHAQRRGAPPRTDARFFSPTSFWNQPVDRGAQVDPNSAGLVSNLLADVNAELKAKNGPWINASSNGVTIVSVPGNQPTVSVTLVARGTRD
jgi:hypothetical protein